MPGTQQINNGSGSYYLTCDEADSTYGLTVTGSVVKVGVMQQGHALADLGIESFEAADWTTDQEQAVKASAGKLTKINLYSTDDAVEGYVFFYDVAAGSVTVGTTAHKKSYKVPAGGVVIDFFDNPVLFGTAITVGVATTYTGSTAPADNKIVVECEYL